MLIPIAAGVFDWCENASMLFLLFQYPDRFGSLAAAAGVATSLKWFALLAGWLGIVVGFALLAVRRLLPGRRRSWPQEPATQTNARETH